ncbi:MAG TPA: beta-N-acetylhexosaminidase [Methylomirabilota bacterium]|jgi:beta-N-acetylhexosaminidase|nr:beta-N-acetylhexosaminidase [Methylomirabilota bacterium]
MTLEEMVGRRLMFGLPGPDVTDADIRLFADTQAGGLILYRRNFETPARLQRMLTRLESALGRRLLVATDHEGGRIVMLGGGVTIFPDNLAAGTAGEVNFVHRQGLFEGRELRRLGVDVNFAPVLDVLTERYSPNIGIRSYGKDPAMVARYGAARIRGLQSSGVSACAKHFPGKGHAPVDAHLGLPVIESDWGEMHAVHLVPFMAAIEAGVDCLMTSHPLYPRLDATAQTPATFSRLIVEQYLRGEVGYRGVIVSDDLEMGAIRDLCGIGDAAVRAAMAGHDLLLVCHTEAAQRAAHAALLDAYHSRALASRDLEQSAARLDALRSKRADRFDGGPPRPERDGEPLAKAFATRAATFVAPRPPGWARRLNGRVVVVFPRLSSLADRITVEAAMLDETRYVTEAMRPYGVEPTVEVVGVEPTEAEIARARASAVAADATLLFLYDAHLYPSNRQLLDAIQSAGGAVAVALMRDPYDAEYLARGVAGVTGYGWRKCQIDAVLARLLG